MKPPRLPSPPPENPLPPDPPSRPQRGADPAAFDDDPDAIALPIDGTLDLHTFRPAELGELLPDYISECLARQIYELRIIHGKGRGILRTRVRTLLARDPRVASLRNADESAGSFGATLVSLQRPRRDS